ATSSDSGTVVPAGVQIGLGVKTASVYTINEQGNLQSTENPLDLAISGTGYFQISLPSGDTAYTRAGSFQLSPAGELVTVDGYTVEPAITVPPNTQQITVNSSGEILVQVAGSVAEQNVGQLQLANFANTAGLNPVGDNLFLETTASGSPVTGNPGNAGFGTMLQGFLETSNVNTVSEITNLITAQRAYEMNSKVIETSDEMLSTITRMR
ncbi:MAG: flagellar basal-body rod protein FlgG, partial [Alphaproteobacteria bacterium]|nr:flagellar basal-body rod protein FlgG [Alphaproteobacteria bacterium]